jgi:hypothetical protein
MWNHALRAIAAAAWLACACGGTSRTSDASIGTGEACAHATDCPSTAMCVCPAGERQCDNAVCIELCQTNTDGSHTCASGGSCRLETTACCEGISNCTLNCIREYFCAP